MKRLFLSIMSAVILAPCIAAAAPQSDGSTFGIGGVLIGSTLSGKWIDAETLLKNDAYASLRIREGDDFAVYSPKGFEGEVKTSAVTLDEVCDTPIFDTFSQDGKKLGENEAWLSIRCAWDPMPRKSAALGTKNATYQSVVEKYLAQQGLAAKPQISQIFKVDLEGDGVDEVVISAHNLHANSSFAAVKGDFSIILLRKIISGKVQEIPVCSFYADGKDNTPQTMHKVIGFADVNGDGILEILTDSSYYEGIWYGVQQVKKGKVNEVLVNGMGL
ncbi:MAG: hypothetical protein J6I40_03570 [Mailhella sp.]|nr:hypothetical protein [Mailhella sp.]